MISPYGLLLALGWLLLVLAVFVGALVATLTAPVFWLTGFGFVPYRYVATSGSRGDRTFLVFVHVVVGTVCFVLAAGFAMVLGSLGFGEWPGVAGLVVVPTATWVVFVARPIRPLEDAPRHWLRDSIASFAIYVLAFLVVPWAFGALRDATW